MIGKLALTLLLSASAFFFAGALAAEDKKDRDTLVRDDLSEMRDSDPVSYTHLTLPPIYSE